MKKNGGEMMKAWFNDLWTRMPRPEPDLYGNSSLPVAGGVMLDGLQDLGRWDELAAEIAQEGQGRVAIAGLPQAGKRLLLSRLRGWDLTPIWKAVSPEQVEGIGIESYGSFLVADLTQPVEGRLLDGDELLLLLGDPALILYVIDAGRGVLAADYRWVALLRAGGRPLLVALNNVTNCDDQAAALAEATRRLGTTVIPISTQSGLNVEDVLLPALLNAVPRLAVPLGREIQAIRQLAARRIIRQAALFAGILGAQPIPLLDLPFQIMLQSGMVMRVGASFGYAPGGGLNREIIATVAGSLAFRYLAQAVVKLVPVVGWLIGGALAAASTLLIGEAAIRYYAAGGTIPLSQWLRRPGSAWRLRRRRDVAGATVEMEPVEEVPVTMVEA
jgi:uncharacterized protein (DUF697 family)